MSNPVVNPTLVAPAIPVVVPIIDGNRFHDEGGSIEATVRCESGNFCN